MGNFVLTFCDEVCLQSAGIEPTHGHGRFAKRRSNSELLRSVELGESGKCDYFVVCILHQY